MFICSHTRFLLLPYGPQTEESKSVSAATQEVPSAPTFCTRENGCHAAYSTVSIKQCKLWQ